LDTNEKLKSEAYQRSSQYLRERCQYLESKKYLTNEEINTIRDIAIKLEKLNTELAYELMHIAHEARPDGNFIKEKLAEYRSSF